MQKQAIEQFLKSLKDERDFDLPFVAMLRALGFFDIHCIHGTFEFGKDFVAKKQENGSVVQYTLQTKFGDLGKNEFSEVRRQCEDMATTEIGHPSMDTTLARKMVVAFTGRFKGDAAITAKEYQNSLLKRQLPPLEYWSQERLLQYMTSEACLIRMDWKAAGRILKECDVGALGPLDIERALRNFELYENDGWKTILFFSILASHCRIDCLRIHAFQMLLVCLRLITAAKLEGKIRIDSAEEMESLILANLATYGSETIKYYVSAKPENRIGELLALANPMEIIVASPRLLLMTEIASLYVLMENLQGEDLSNARTYFDDILSLEASTHPLSDRYAISILAIGSAAQKLGIDAKPWVAKIVEWVTRKYDDLGLSDSNAHAVEELFTVLVSANEDKFLGLVSKRSSSLVATALLDLMCVCGYSDNYNQAVNEWKKRGLVPISVAPETYPQCLFPERGGIISVETNDFSDQWKEDVGSNQATHHAYISPASGLDEASIRLALWLLLRDRWSIDFAMLQRK